MDPFRQPDPFDEALSSWASTPIAPPGTTLPAVRSDPFDSALEEWKARDDEMLAFRRKQVERLKQEQASQEQYDQAVQGLDSAHPILGPIASELGANAAIPFEMQAKEAQGPVWGAMGKVATATGLATPEEVQAARDRTEQEALQKARDIRETAAAIGPSDPNMAQRVLGGVAGVTPMLAAGAVDPALGAAVAYEQSAAPAYSEARSRGVSPGAASVGSTVQGGVGAALALPILQAVRGVSGPIKQSLLPGILRHVTSATAEGGLVGTASEATSIAREAAQGKKFTWEEIRQRLGDAALETAATVGAVSAPFAPGAVKRGNQQFKDAKDFVDALNLGVKIDEASMYDKLAQQRAQKEQQVMERARRVSGNAADQRLGAIARRAGAEVPTPEARLEVTKRELGSRSGLRTRCCATSRSPFSRRSGTRSRTKTR